MHARHTSEAKEEKKHAYFALIFRSHSDLSPKQTRIERLKPNSCLLCYAREKKITMECIKTSWNKFKRRKDERMQYYYNSLAVSRERQFFLLCCVHTFLLGACMAYDIVHIYTGKKITAERKAIELPQS